MVSESAGDIAGRSGPAGMNWYHVGVLSSEVDGARSEERLTRSGQALSRCYNGHCENPSPPASQGPLTCSDGGATMFGQSREGKPSRLFLCSSKREQRTARRKSGQCKIKGGPLMARERPGQAATGAIGNDWTHSPTPQGGLPRKIERERIARPKDANRNPQKR